MAHKVSMQQIADRLGVSKYTVSQALSGKEGVSEGTRREVIAMARALGYRVRKDAVGEENVQTYEGERIEPAQPEVWIGLDERYSHEPNFWKRVRQGIEAGSIEHELSPHFFTFGRDKASVAAIRELIEDAKRRGITGFIMVGRCPAELLLLLNRTGLPLVLVDHEESVIQADAVLNANIEAGRMACHHLLSQGCRSVAFVGRDSFAVSFRERFWGCRLALEEFQSSSAKQPPSRQHAGVQLKKWTVPYGSQPWRQSLERRISSALAAGGDPAFPDGFVCANDEIALGLMQLLQSYDIVIPASCKVVGIDNTAASLEAAVPLTTVDLAKEWLGMRAVEAFVRRRLRPEAQYENITLAARLIIRASG